MSLNRLERLREAEARSCRDLPLQQYAALLCEAIRDYDFPVVTYDFTEEKPLHHGSMLAVEQYIGTLLHSKDFSAVKDGLSNVLYWGYARQPIRDFRVSDFRKTILDPEREPKLDQFAQLIRSGRSDLFNIKELQFAPVQSDLVRKQNPDVSGSYTLSCARPEDRQSIREVVLSAPAELDVRQSWHFNHQEERNRLRHLGVLVPRNRHGGQRSPCVSGAAASEPSMSKEPSSPWRTHRQRTRPGCFWTARQAGRSIGDRPSQIGQD